MENSGKRSSVIDSTYCINKAFLCSGNNDIGHIREVLYSQIKISIDSIPYRPSPKIHWPLEFQVMSDIFLFIPCVTGYNTQVANGIRATYTPQTTGHFVVQYT